MLLRIDARVAGCLLKLRAPEFEPLREWLEASLQRTMTDLVFLNEMESMCRAQGAAKELKDLLRAVEEAPALANKPPAFDVRP